jgi:hypothetical protein
MVCLGLCTALPAADRVAGRGWRSSPSALRRLREIRFFRRPPSALLLGHSCQSAHACCKSMYQLLRASVRRKVTEIETLRKDARVRIGAVQRCCAIRSPSWGYPKSYVAETSSNSTYGQGTRSPNRAEPPGVVGTRRGSRSVEYRGIDSRAAKKFGRSSSPAECERDLDLGWPLRWRR